MTIPENFISLEQVVAAAEKLGFLERDEGWFTADEVIGRMTGLDMTRYGLELKEDMRGYLLVRIPE